MKYASIPIDQIIVGERRRIDYGDIDALAAGIKRVGLLSPIVVDQNGSGYRLICGERRLRAAMKLGWSKIPGQLRGELTEAELREIELEETKTASPSPRKRSGGHSHQRSV